VCVYNGTIAVEDVSGARFELHAFVCWRFLKRILVFQLDTGEDVRRVDDNTFEVIPTGERLLRI
jgi:hypothetical protein